MASSLVDLGDPNGWPTSETALTAEVIQPRVAQRVDALGITGLIVAGDGRPRAAPNVRWKRWDFRPDVAVLFRNARVLAIEVKLLRGRGTGDAASKGFGQAAIYRRRYEYSCLALYSSYTREYVFDAEADIWSILPDE